MKNIFVFLAVVAVFGIRPVLAIDETEADSRRGVLTYFGTGSAERAPDFAEVYINFNVGCQASAFAVTDELRKASGKIWNTIMSKVSPAANTETEKTYWSDVSGIRAYDPTTLDFPGDGKSAVRRNECRRENVRLTSRESLVFQGSQRIGVRSVDADWIEALSNQLKKLPQSENPAEVKITVESISYGVTKQTQAGMQAEVDQKARDEATGQNSYFELDRHLFNFESAHFVKRAVSNYVPIVGEVIGQPVSHGQAPPVSLRLKVRYGFHVETTDLLANSTAFAINNPQYEETGEAEARADYARSTITVSTGCRANQKEAIEAIENVFSHLSEKAAWLQNGAPTTETDSIEIAETQSYGYSPLEAVEYSTDAAGRRNATKWLDTCSSLVLTTNKDATVYYAANRTITIKSRKFSELSEMVEAAPLLSPQNPFAVDVIVKAEQPTGQITEESRKNLALIARAKATQNLFKIESSFSREASDTARFRYRNAYLISLDVIDDNYRPRLATKARGMAAPRASPEGADLSDPLDIAIVARDNETRPKARLKQSYAYEYRILSQELIEGRGTKLRN
jgi:hypothetical protein